MYAILGIVAVLGFGFWIYKKDSKTSDTGVSGSAAKVATKPTDSNKV